MPAQTRIIHFYVCLGAAGGKECEVIMKKLVIDQYDDHQRIDKYLKKVLVQAPSSLIYKMLRKKDVKVNGKRVKENYILHSGDEVELFLYEDKFKEYTKPLTIYELPITFKVVYEDTHILIVDKPAGLLVHEDINESVNTLSNQVLTYLYQKGEYDPEKNISFTPGPVHRLDRNTSGLAIWGHLALQVVPSRQVLQNLSIL